MLVLRLNYTNFYLFEQSENLASSQIVYSRHVATHISFHRIGLARTGLSISKTGDFGTLKSIFDKWADGL